ncbi:MAG TPA: acyl carrier protein [Sutterella sp.]|jgi:acyl carrier protein|nr:acyl carrier protein [Sutterella sp.]
MVTNEQILAKVTEILTHSFEVPAGSIKPEARLYEDLDLDSIDAVDMIVELKPFIGNRQVKAADFKKVRTVGDVVEVIARILNEPA